MNNMKTPNVKDQAAIGRKAKDLVNGFLVLKELGLQ
jgi:hypothetical protein